MRSSDTRDNDPCSKGDVKPYVNSVHAVFDPGNDSISHSSISIVTITLEESGGASAINRYIVDQQTSVHTHSVGRSCAHPF